MLVPIAVSAMTRFGTYACSSSIRLIAMSVKRSPVITVAEIGTSISFSGRFCAVTMISSSSGAP